MGIEPTPSAWKAEVLPLNYTRHDAQRPTRITHRSKVAGSLDRLLRLVFFPVVVGEGFEPSKA
jgi:hypothetical protein